MDIDFRTGGQKSGQAAAKLADTPPSAIGEDGLPGCCRLGRDATIAGDNSTSPPDDGVGRRLWTFAI